MASEDFDWSRVRVREVGTAVAERRRRRSARTFTLLNHVDAVAGFTAMKCPAALVWCALLYRAWAEKRAQVQLPTTLLKSWGVHRKVWGRALPQLEAAGLIRVARRPGRSATVTMLKPGRRRPGTTRP